MSHDPYEDMVGLEVEVVEDNDDVTRGRLIAKSYNYIIVGERILDRVVITRKHIKSLRVIEDGK